MELKLYQVDAFARQLFEGNPAAICPLQAWLPDSLMQSIAAENNLSETAFFVQENNHYHIRWFTPNKEVTLCGHATLATAHVIFKYLLKIRSSDIRPDNNRIFFMSKSGELIVTLDNIHNDCSLLSMDFPAEAPTSCTLPAVVSDALNIQPIACLASQDYFLIYEKEQDIHIIEVDLSKLAKIDLRAVCITAPSEKYDFVNRVFAPKYGIDEDPVTGSAFTQLAPYWAKQLNKNSLRAKQISPRGGEVSCHLLDNRVIISGYTIDYLQGSIQLPNDIV